MAAMGQLTVTFDDNAKELLELLRSLHNRLDEHERQVQELWRRIHSLNETLEARGPCLK